MGGTGVGIPAASSATTSTTTTVTIGSQAGVQRTLTIVPAVASAAAVHAAVTLTTVPQTVTTGITNPVVCRALSITGNAAGMAGNVTVVGTDANGDAASDVIALAGTSTVLGVVAFATVTSIALPARRVIPACRADPAPD